MDFGEILTKAWKTIWRHKILWLFGILAGGGATSSGGGGGGGTSSIQTPFEPGNWNGLDFMDPATQRGIENFLDTLANIPPWVWVVSILVLVLGGIILSVVLWALSLLVGTLGTTGVIKGTAMADESEPDAKPFSFGEIFQGIKPYYWKVFLLNLGWEVVSFFVGIILILPIILLVVCTCCLGLLLLIPIGWFINLMINFTIIAILEEDKGVFDGIERAWQVITRKLGNVVVMFLILGIGQWIIGFIIGLPLIITTLPVVINLVISGLEGLGVGLILSVVLFLLFLPLVIFLNGVLKAYVLASWTLTYRRLTGEDGLNPILLSDEASNSETP